MVTHESILRARRFTSGRRSARIHLEIVLMKRTSSILLTGWLTLGGAIANAESPGLTPSLGGNEGEWTFGIGTGLSSFSLDGDIGFATSEGGFITDVDLDNSDTGDLIDSAFGLSGIAINGPWSITAAFGTVKLEDSDRAIKAEWERSKMELLVGYRFLEAGTSQFGVLGGVRSINHDWNIKLRDPDLSDVSVRDVDEDWTDIVIGVTHAMPIAANWLWSNRVDFGFGDTEESYYLATAVHWMPIPHWSFNASIRYTKLELNNASDIDKKDFYYYDVDEPAFGIGFMYLW